MPSANVIPTGADPDYTQRTKLDGREYTLRFLWNPTSERWTLTLYDVDDTHLCELKLVCNIPLLRAYHYDPRIPAGELVVVSEQVDDVSPPGLDELGIGKRCTLTYASAE